MTALRFQTRGQQWRAVDVCVFAHPTVHSFLKYSCVLCPVFCAGRCVRSVWFCTWNCCYVCFVFGSGITFFQLTFSDDLMYYWVSTCNDSNLRLSGRACCTLSPCVVLCQVCDQCFCLIFWLQVGCVVFSILSIAIFAVFCRHYAVSYSSLTS